MITPLRWQIGDVEIIQLVELVDHELFSSFIPEAKPEKIKKIPWLIPHFATPEGKLIAHVQSFLIRSQGKNILIDTCNGNGKERPHLPSWGKLHTDFLERFRQSGTTPEQVDFVACTHLHFDHVGWNTQLENGQWVPVFPNAHYLFSQAEYDYWIKKPAEQIIDDFNGLDDSVTPIVEAGLAKFVADDYQLDSNIRFLPTPGHTPHHISIAIESKSQKAIITGDVLHHPCQMVHSEWTTLADTYPDQTIETRNKFFNEVKDTDTLIIGSHFANPVAGMIITSRDGLKFSPRAGY